MSARFRFECRGRATPLPHFWEHTVGSDHARMALRADWRSQLVRAHAELGFRHVRFHGLLDDDMGTLVCQDERPLHSFFNAPGGASRASLWRIDARHANAPAAWHKLGDPQYPSAGELARLARASEVVSQPLPLRRVRGDISFAVTVPPQGVAAIELRPARRDGR